MFSARELEIGRLYDYYYCYLNVCQLQSYLNLELRRFKYYLLLLLYYIYLYISGNQMPRRL